MLAHGAKGKAGGHMYFESDQIERWSRHIRQVRDDLDAADQAKPESVDAGPFTPLVIDMVEATVADYVHLALRLATLADRLDKVADYYRKVEEVNQELLQVTPDSPFYNAGAIGLSMAGEHAAAWGLTKDRDQE